MKKLANYTLYILILLMFLIGCSNKSNKDTQVSTLQPATTTENEMIFKRYSEAAKLKVELLSKDSSAKVEIAAAPVKETISILIKQGDSGDMVKNLQLKLYTIGYDLLIDSSFGNQTSGVIKKIQILNNIEPTGNIDIKTDSVIKAIKDIRSYVKPTQVVQAQPIVSTKNVQAGLTSIPNIKTSPGGAEQVIVVLADSYGSIRATLTTYEKSNGIWQMITTGQAVTGMNGFSNNRHEGDLTSPTGKYGIPFLFGNAVSPGVKLPYRRVQVGDYWVSNKILSEYNVWMHYDGSDAKERLYDYEALWTKVLYKYAAVIDFNYGPNKIMGKGSGIFLHIAPYNGGGTLGCIGINETQLVKVIKWLDPSKNPVIIMGVRGSI